MLVVINFALSEDRKLQEVLVFSHHDLVASRKPLQMQGFDAN